MILAMAFNILKLNQKSILKMDMDQINELLQKTLPSEFGFEDDIVMESLRDCLAELKSSKLLWTEPLPDSEKPRKTFGAFSLEDYEIETMLESGERSAVNEDDRQFHRQMTIILFPVVIKLFPQEHASKRAGQPAPSSAY